MNVARRRGVGSVRIAVRVEPNKAQRLPLAREEAGRARHRADRDAVVAAEDQRQPVPLEALLHRRPQLLAERHDRRLVPELPLADLLGLGDHHVEIAGVLDLVPELLEARLEIGDADGRGPHVDAAATGAEVDGNADHVDVALLGGHGQRSLARAVRLSPARARAVPSGRPSFGARARFAIPRWVGGRLTRSSPAPPSRHRSRARGGATAIDQRISDSSSGRAGDRTGSPMFPIVE